MILEYIAPGARRRTHTAGTTEAGLLGLLDVGNHDIKVLKHGSEVNAAFARGITGIGYAKSWTFRKSHRERLARVLCKFARCKKLEARGGIEPPIKVLQTFALPLGDRASDALHITRGVHRHRSSAGCTRAGS